ncbi:DNA-3-methyladenine glycosylase [Haliscomenobacter sp.]|uniref:DNA-3-methyladenine glycosylase family protein n=1 Tax=Haliscomenobacter sp. TaxID=2717303 RepID=UPI0035934E44
MTGHILKSDPILEKIILQVPQPQIATTNDVFHDLMSCVLEQQIHYRSTKKVFQKMLNSAKLERLSPANFYQFEERALGNIKLAAGKYETIVGVLALWEANKMDWQLLQDDEVVSTLSTVKGIGNWTIDMILLYTLQRPNIFPYDDFHLKQIMVSLYKLDPKAKLKAQMMEIAENWGNQKSLAVLYLLAWKQYQKSL